MTLWKGRFNTRLHPRALAFSSSLPFDKKLYREDIEGSLAHAAMLVRQGILTREEGMKIRKGLNTILREISTGKFVPEVHLNNAGRFVAEDIHMAIEHRLIEKVGEAGGKLHTARSRNDQIALDERLYLRSAISRVLNNIRKLQKTLLGKAEEYGDVVMPGYTHLQQAQPILLPHHFLAYVAMLDRDFERLENCRVRANKSPLGAGALAGTSFPIDRRSVARDLQFDDILENSIDAVADRDALLEFLAGSAIVMMHLSRLCEELVLWSTQEWSFLTIGDAWTTGSSIMPQKKNPDMAELVRAKTGRVYGNLVTLLTVMKGLPLAYNRDLQEDKEPLFDTEKTVVECLEISSAMLSSASFNRSRFEEQWNADHLLATDLADYLVRKGMAFRKAHTIVGELVSRSVRKGISLRKLSLRDYRRQSTLFSEDLYDLLDFRTSLAGKKSAGSTSPKEVKRMILSWKKKLASK